MEAGKIPDEGLCAEMNKDWNKAASIYQAYVKKDPNRIDLLFRLADIYSHVKQYINAIIVLKKIEKKRPKDAELCKRISILYAMDNKPREALVYIQKAITLDPTNLEYIKSQGDLAHWIGDSELVIESYSKVLSHKPDDELLLKIALNRSWKGELDLAYQDFEKYFLRNKGNAQAYLNYAKNEIWRGDYAHAEEILEIYKKRFGDTDDLKKIEIDLYTRAEWPDRSKTLLVPLMKKYPEDYNLFYFKALREYYNHEPIKAVKSYETVKKLRPDSQDTKDLYTYITVREKSYMEADGFYYNDSDDITHARYGVKGSYIITPELSVYLRYWQDYLKAEEGSPFLTFDNKSSIRVDHIGIGVKQTISTLLTYDLQVGYAQIESNENDTMYILANAYLDVNDQNDLHLSFIQDYYPISPLSVSLGIKESRFTIEHNYRPDFIYTIVSLLSYTDFSDDNNRWMAIFAPRKSMLRSQEHKLDVGVRAWLYGFDKDTHYGYYAPELYESYNATLFYTYKQSQDNEFTIMGAVGVIKDDSMSNYEFSYSIDGVGRIGIYKNIYLKLRAGYTNNSRSLGPSYSGTYGGATLQYRF